MTLPGILLIVAGVTGAVAVGEGVVIKKSWEKNALLQASNDAMAAHIKQVNEVLKEVDRTHATNLALPDSQLFDGLLPKAANP